MVRRMSNLAASLLIALAALAVVSSFSCRNSFQAPGDGADPGPAAEPEQYSAVVVRIVDDGTRREVSITREARLGEKRREEWTEEDRNRALIWRPDLGKSYLLDLDRHIYVELEIAAVSAGETSGPNPLNHGPTDPTGAIQAIDRALDDRPAPARIETRILPDQRIDGHTCKVYEQRASFPDGQTEVTRTFRAHDLAGLALKVEALSENGTLTVITTRRDVSVEVDPATFIVPADFKKVEKLSQ
jgi:hypothetical protein